MNNLISVKSFTTVKIESILYLIIGLILIIAIYFLAPYSKDYLNYSRGFYLDASSRLEPTYFFFTKIIKLFTDNVIFLYLLYGGIAITIKLKIINKLSDFPFYTIFLYMSYYFLLHEITQIRASVAVGFLLLNIKPLYDRDFKKFILFVSIAFLFHYSSLIMLPLWFIKPQSLNKYFYLSLIPISYILVRTGFSLTSIISFIPIDEIQVLLKHHTYTMEQGIGNKINIYNLLQLFRSFVCCILIIFSPKIIQYNKYAGVLIKIYTFSLISVVLFHDLPVISFRISEYLGVVEVIVFPFILYFFKQKIFVFIPVIALFLFHSLYNLNLINNL